MSDKISPFAFINSITFDKNDMTTEPTFEKDYNPYMVNTGLSYFQDCLLFANEMNKHPHLGKKYQYKFLINAVEKKKRFSKWEKKEKLDNDMEAVIEYYNVSVEKAKYYLSVLNEDQLNIIKQKIYKGGRK